MVHLTDPTVLAESIPLHMFSLAFLSTIAVALVSPEIKVLSHKYLYSVTVLKKDYKDYETIFFRFHWVASSWYDL